MPKSSASSFRCQLLESLKPLKLLKPLKSLKSLKTFNFLSGLSRLSRLSRQSRSSLVPCALYLMPLSACSMPYAFPILPLTSD